ncbi:MAG: tetratricopeptide repeat protein [Armatimonadetes bacterium]|nr:tetratricopeptide repeat protein [Armatimonadota bacterium]
MVCPYCGTKNLPHAAICNHCGAILQGAPAQQPPWRPRKSGQLRRLAAAGKALYQANLYRVRLGGLQSRTHTMMAEAEERFEAELKTEKASAQTRLSLAALHLLQDHVEKGVQDLQLAQRLGASGEEFDNNFGVALARRGSLPKAIEMFGRAIGSNGRAPQPHANLAHALSVSGEDPSAGERALQEVQALIALDGQNPANYNRLGIVLCREGNPDQAVVQFGQALKLAVASPSAQADAHCNLGVAHALAGDEREAARELFEALSVDSGHARALANEGLLELRSGEMDFGLERLHDAAQLDARSADIQGAFGYALCRAGAINEGVRAAHEALALNPSLCEPCYNLGKAYADARLFDIADRYITRAAQSRPRSWEVQTTLGVVRLALGQTSQAVGCFQAANRLIQNQPRVLLNLASALALNRQDQEAERLLKQLSRTDKDNPAVPSAMGWLYLLRDSASLAAGELEIALEKGDKSAIVQNNYGLAQIGLGAYEVALTHFRRALSLDPELGQVHFNLGGAYALLKQPDPAIKEWEAAAKYEPGNADLLVNLGVAYYRKGNFDGAVTQFRRVLQIRQDRPEDHSNLGLAYAKQGVVLRAAAAKGGPAGIALMNRGQNDEKMRQSVEKQKQAIEMFDRALKMDPRNVMLHSNRGLACYFANRAEEAMAEWTNVTKIDPLYARRRGKAQQSEFDDSLMDFRPLNISERAIMPPLKTADYLYRLLWGYDTDDWELMISDPALAPLPPMLREARFLERNLRAQRL